MRFLTAVAICIVPVIAGCAQNDLIVQKQAELEGRLEQMAKGNILVNARISEIENAMKGLDAKLQVNAAALEEMKAAQQEPKIEPQEIESSELPAEPAPSQPPKIELINNEASPHDKAEGPSEAYIKAFGVYSANNYKEAIEAFGAFIKEYPQSEYAANAQYWTGECYYTQREYKKALEAFQKVLDDYPKSGKAPDAMLKIGFSHISMNEPDKARAILESLAVKYPKSPAAVKAKERLKESRSHH